MFNHKSKKFKKKKKWFSKINFVLAPKRALLTLNFVKYMILLNCKRGKKKMQFQLFTPLYEFIINEKINSILKIKYKVYRLKMIQMQA